MIGGVIRKLERAGAWIAGACLVAIMLIISIDAVSRYAFRAPLPWSIDVVSLYLMVAAVYFVVSETFRHGDHINLNLVRSRMSRPVRTATSVLWLLPASVVFAIIAYGSAANMIASFRASEYISGYLHWPIWLSYFPIALGSGLLTLRLLNHAATLLLRGGDPGVRLDGEHEA